MRITVPGGSKILGAHRASWLLHYGEIPAGMEICHHCDNPPCVRPDHLFLGTHAENFADARDKGRMNRGAKNGLSKLTDAKVKKIRELAKTGMSQWKIGARFGVHQMTVSRVVRRTIWKHLP
jgi:hypothetical protein